jgi:hypothetical protein
MDERIEPAFAASARVGGARRTTAIVAAAAAGLLVVGAAGFALAASPATPDAGGSTALTATASGDPSPSASAGNGGAPGKRGPSAGRLGDLVRGALGGRLLGAIHITAIDGSNLSLATQDGWSRTITVGQATTITRAGKTIPVAALKVGDEVRFAETRNADGTFTIDRLDVLLPTVVGQVTAKGDESITLKRLDGTTATIHVGSSTTYRTRGNANASLADVSVGSYVVATGTARSDGSIDAVTVATGQPGAIEGGRGFGRFFGPRMPGMPGSKGQPAPTPSASGSIPG